MRLMSLFKNFLLTLMMLTIVNIFLKYCVYLFSITLWHFVQELTIRFYLIICHFSNFPDIGSRRKLNYQFTITTDAQKKNSNLLLQKKPQNSHEIGEIDGMENLSDNDCGIIIFVLPLPQPLPLGSNHFCCNKYIGSTGTRT